SGIAVLCIRKAQGKFSNAEEEYDLALSGISAAIDTLAADGIVDPRHVGIGGLSFGSQVALWAIRKSDRFAAATLSSAQFEPHFYWATALPGSGMPDTLANRWGLGDPDTDPEGWNRLSATSDAAGLDTPLLMQLPEAEARLVIEFHTRLKRAGKPAELFVFADEPHIKTQPVHQFAVNARNLDWYRFWLADFEDPNPQKQDRYARWRELRAGHPLQRPAP
ncbi:MAG TPA: prolyl oligopeptidase family serine peptidase, partial [Allosphingosinicella sp.]|nr:prolyl oligopeptidase family serine peptidase [Allosphingosinicella sp.]